MKKFFAYSFIICAAIMLVLAGCTNESTPVSRGTLRISINDTIAKGIDSNISMNAAYYVINGECGFLNSINNVRIEPGQKKIIDSISTGMWTFSAIAYNSNGNIIGRSDSTKIQVLPSRTTEAHLNIYEESGNGTFTVNLNVEDFLNSYTLHIYKLVNGKITAIGEEIPFAKISEKLVASTTLENGFYAFTISSSNTELTLPPIETVRIVAGDSVSATYEITDTGSFSITMGDDIVETPSVTISFEDGVATATVSGMNMMDLVYTWYADRTELLFTGSSINITDLTDYETITCVVQDTLTNIVWSCTESL